MFLRKQLIRIAEALEKQNKLLIKAVGLHYYQLGAGRYKACYESLWHQVQQRAPDEDTFDILTDVADGLLDDDIVQDVVALNVDRDYFAAASFDTTQILADANIEIESKVRVREQTREAGEPTPA